MFARLAQITTKGSKLPRVFAPFCGAGLDPAAQTVQSEAAKMACGIAAAACGTGGPPLAKINDWD
jgi:hypothetical protein